MSARHVKRMSAVFVAAVGLSFLSMTADAGVDLGSAQGFAVLGGSGITNTGPTVIFGDLGVWPNDTATGFPPGIVFGQMHLGNAVAMQAQADALTAYTALAGISPTQDLTGMDLGGLTLTPGVYFFSSSAFLTGTLTLDAQGDPNAQFVFQMGSTLITASSSSVLTINGADGCNVWWQVGSSATLGTDTAFTGNILANTSITLTTDATIIGGRAFALNGALTMDSNIIDATCLPAPGALALLGIAGLVTRRRRERTGY
jgi:hypothetical protein